MISERNVKAVLARYLVRCFLSGRAPQIAELARQSGVAPLLLSRMFRRATGRKLAAFIDAQQVLRARRLLRWSETSVLAIARSSGYETKRSFYRAFRRLTGTTPLRFRTRSREAVQPCRACQFAP